MSKSTKTFLSYQPRPGDQTMKSFRLIINLMNLAILGFSTPTFSQIYDSYGPRVDALNRIYSPPQLGIIKNVLCKDYINAPLGALKYKACSDGIDAAAWMAEKYAANSGRYIGCLDGMNQGINDGYFANVNPSPSKIEEAEKFVAGATYESAKKRASEKAKAEAQTDSSKQLVDRYRKVIGLTDPQSGSVILPNKDYDYPQYNFNGFDDGYNYDVLSTNTSHQSDLQKVYDLGWITSSADEETKITARSVYQLQNSDGGSLCSLEQTIFGRTSLPRLGFWDYWKAQRNLDFKLYRWDNKDWAWDIFVNDERTLSHYVNYDKIPSSTKIIQVPVYRRDVKVDANGTPVQARDAAGNLIFDAQGKPVYEYIEVEIGKEDKVVPITAQEAQELRQLYLSMFKISYERDLANHYASIHYNKEGLEKYKLAKIIGGKIGQEVAHHRAYSGAYNRKYKLESAKVFAATVKDLYEVNFDRLLGIFETQSIYDLESVTLIGNIDDNIFTPGEGLATDVSIANLGEVSKNATLYMSHSNDIVSSGNGFDFSISPLKRKRFSTPVLGTINPGLLARENVSVKVGLTNPGNLAEIAKTLNSSSNQSIKLRNYIELEKVESTLSIFNGEVEVSAVVQNPASIAMPVVADLVLTDNRSGLIIKTPVAALPGGSSQRFILKASHFDPLDLIMSKNLSIKVDAVLAGKVVSSLKDSISISGDSTALKIEYFARLVTGLSSNPGIQPLEDRISFLQEFIFESVKAEVGKKIRWGKNKEFVKTSLNVVLEQYLKLQRAGAIDAQAQKDFDALAKHLAQLAPTLKAKGWFNDKKHRKAFLKVLKQFSPSL